MPLEQRQNVGLLFFPAREHQNKRNPLECTCGGEGGGGGERSEVVEEEREREVGAHAEAQRAEQVLLCRHHCIAQVPEF